MLVRWGAMDDKELGLRLTRSYLTIRQASPSAISRTIVKGLVAILCPKSGSRISTGIILDRSTFDALPAESRLIDCWVCGATHPWTRRWAMLLECDDPDLLRTGMPIAKERSSETA